MEALLVGDVLISTPPCFGRHSRCRHPGQHGASPHCAAARPRPRPRGGGEGGLLVPRGQVHQQLPVLQAALLRLEVAGEAEAELLLPLHPQPEAGQQPPQHGATLEDSGVAAVTSARPTT